MDLTSSSLNFGPPRPDFFLRIFFFIVFPSKNTKENEKEYNDIEEDEKGGEENDEIC